MTTYQEQRPDRRSGAWSEARWAVLGAIVLAIIAAVVLIVVYSGGGSGGTGGY